MSDTTTSPIPVEEMLPRLRSHLLALEVGATVPAGLKVPRDSCVSVAQGLELAVRILRRYEPTPMAPFDTISQKGDKTVIERPLTPNRWTTVLDARQVLLDDGIALIVQRSTTSGIGFAPMSAWAVGNVPSEYVGHWNARWDHAHSYFSVEQLDALSSWWLAQRPELWHSTYPSPSVEKGE